MLQLKALKNPVPLKENTPDLHCLLTSPSLEAYMIPVLQVDSVIRKVTMLFEDKLPHQKHCYQNIQRKEERETFQLLDNSATTLSGKYRTKTFLLSQH